MESILEGLAGPISFTSIFYLAFLLIGVLGYFLLPGSRTRSLWLLVLSVLLFATYSPKWLWVIASVTTFSYFIGLILGRVKQPTRRKWVLVAAILALICVLGVFKYLEFGIQLTNALSGFIGNNWSMPALKLAMPIGISYWVFQSIAYVVDVYRGKATPVTNFLYFSASVIFFPIFTMGPITRIDDIAPQLSRKYRFQYRKMQSGLLLIGWGFFKKLLIADRLAVFVNTVFDAPREVFGTSQGLLFFVAAVFFAVQLYADFSGYSDIARGSARLFGVDLPLNFDAPYFARSVSEFWRRWHMTLMDWLKNYVYIPLGGNRKGVWRKRLNILATFFVSGLWHGAGLSYIAWGLLNGFYQVAGDVLAPFSQHLTRKLRIDRESFGHKLFQTIFTFVLITIGWVFFRANSLSDALYILPRMFIPTIWIFGDGTMVNQGLGYSELIVALVSVALVWGFDYAKSIRKIDVYAWICVQPLYFRWICYYGLIFVIILFGYYGASSAEFVYFQF